MPGVLSDWTGSRDPGSVTDALDQMAKRETLSTELTDLLGSSGWISGGVVTDAGGNTVDVALGTGLFRATDDEMVPLVYLPWAASAGLAVAADTVKHVGIEYNAGIPQAVVEATEGAFDNTTKFQLATVINEAGTIHVDDHRHEALNHAWRDTDRYEGAFHIRRDVRVGGLILGETGTRNVTLSAGVLHGINASTIAAIDTSGADRFDLYYRDGGAGFTKVATQSQWPNTQWDDGDGGLATLGNNKWGTLWVYLETDGDLVMLYGQAESNTEAGAGLQTAPPAVPDRVQEHGILIGRFVFQESAATATVESVFTAQFTATGVTDHGELAGLPAPANDHDQYLLHTEDIRCRMMHVFDPVSADTFFIGATPKAITLTYCSFIVKAATNVVFNIEKRDEDDPFSAGTEILDSDKTATVTHGTHTITAPDVVDVAARQSLWVTIQSITGDPQEMVLYVEYTVDG